MTENSGGSASLERRGDDLLFIGVGNPPMETTEPVHLLKNSEAPWCDTGNSNSTKNH